ncbi:Long-chain-fatty-acid--CoA ligase [Ralstonia condita]|uniref:Long-chain-fatty-acid--CoA ligase n=1 Tax=Ralstonia condita TaxID=3058600 RepID=A0ABM9JRV2_9RALS|nr:long-chain fatty acid--CoA ligase [Ralstonia sp. LMG 7141]MDE2204649.1 long-chain fatty acid--CoA ligase [Burkholderiaceae bacterium]CAJ0802017.1 Long-chain-fatty-acid--CoA ligase [Ralstonia sp. LMG 7141]
MYVVDWLHKNAQHTPDKLALVDVHSGRRVTYRQLDERASRFAEVLTQQLRLAPGARVAVLAHNSAAYFEMLYGCAKAGMVMVCLNWRLPVAELLPILEDCTPDVLVAGDGFIDVATDLVRARPMQVLYLAGEPSACAPAGWREFEAALASASGHIIDMPCRDEHEIWHLLYTSGTTGRPKGVIQTYGMVFFNAVNAMLANKITRDDVFLSVLPFFHTGGLNLYANPLLHAGGTVHILRQFDAQTTLDKLDRRSGEGITMFLAVPSVYLFLSQHAGFAQADFSAIRNMSAGGSPVPQPLLQAYLDKGVTLCFGFGMTETGPTVFVCDEATARRKIGTIGKPVGSMLTRIVDPLGNDVAPGERGELLIKGPGVTPGYWNLPEATAAAIRDGWLHSGDIAYVDDEGDYYIVDRAKDMFISGGENVYPAEVENVLFQLPEVSEAAVIGTADARWGEVGVAVVVVRNGVALDPDAVIAHCKARLAGYKVPRHVHFIDVLPRTPSGKVEKHKLRARFSAR